MQTQEEKSYRTYLKQINWNGFPEDEPKSMKKFIAALGFDDVDDRIQWRILSLFRELPDADHPEIQKEWWYYLLGEMDQIWKSSPAAFGRFFLSEYYRNNDSPFGNILRKYLRQGWEDKQKPERNAWLVIGELVIFQMSIALSEAIHEEEIQVPDYSQGGSAAGNFEEESWFLPGPTFMNYGNEAPFGYDDDVPDKLLIFFANLFKPGCSLTRYKEIEYSAYYFDFDGDGRELEDNKYDWEATLFTEDELIQQLDNRISETYSVIENQLCACICQRYPDPLLLLEEIKRPDTRGRFRIFKLEFDEGEIMLTSLIEEWWEGVQSKAAGMNAGFN